MAGSVAAPVAAQDSGGGGEDDARAAAIARGDSIRATLVQPPGDRGVTIQDVVRLPFRALGAAITVAALPPLALYALIDEMGLDESVPRIDRALRDARVRVRPDFIGSRSWPALVVRYEGLDPFFVEGGVSLRAYTLARAGLAFGDTLLGAELAGTHHRMREVHAWGVGMDTPDDRFDYARTRRLGEAAAVVGHPEAPAMMAAKRASSSANDVSMRQRTSGWRERISRHTSIPS
ncbi:MAG: hypothetical protein KY453_11250, partial [Gemmatimonadetes bacterium]|nr:hypothetical protein [Gemmatimonadota bacterium]